jgi:hypothetical protein
VRSGLCARTVDPPQMPSRPGEFHSEPLTDPDVNLSIHPARVIARRLPPSAKPSGSSRYDPVGPSPTAMTCPLCSTGITPLHRYYGQSAPLRRIGTAACGGLRSTPDCRPRRTCLHLSYSYASPFGPALLVTQDPITDLGRGSLSDPPLRAMQHRGTPGVSLGRP